MAEIVSLFTSERTQSSLHQGVLGDVLGDY